MAKKNEYGMRVRDLAEECSGPGYEYLGHMQNPEVLRKGHNDDDTNASLAGPNNFFKRMKKHIDDASAASAAAPSGNPSPTPSQDSDNPIGYK